MKVGILGANGRMGQQLLEAVVKHKEMELCGAYVRDGHDLIGQNVLVAGQPAGTLEYENLRSASGLLNVLIDFTLPETLENHVNWCRERNVALVIGTTGLSDDQFAMLDDAAKNIPIMWAANYSVGVNLLMSLAAMATKALKDEADIEIIEAHHRHKIDAPSGTAIALGESVASAMGKQLSEVSTVHQNTSTARDDNAIGFSVIRGGDIVGEHTVLYASDGERVELTHKASSRMTFAKGAVDAGAWLFNKQPGLYSMQDMLRTRLQIG